MRQGSSKSIFDCNVFLFPWVYQLALGHVINYLKCKDHKKKTKEKHWRLSAANEWNFSCKEARAKKSCKMQFLECAFLVNHPSVSDTLSIFSFHWNPCRVWKSLRSCKYHDRNHKPSGIRKRYSWFATTWQGGHVGGQYNRIFSRIFMKMEFSTTRREML